MQDIHSLLDPLRALQLQLGVLLPRLALALLLLAGGWLLAKAVRLGVVKALRALNFHVLAGRAGIDEFLQQGGTDQDTTTLVGALAQLLVLLAALFVAFDTLGLTQVTDLIGRMLLFVPRLLVALLVLVLGSYFARFAGQAVRNYCASADIGDGALLGRLVQYGVMVFVLLLAVDHLDIGRGLVQQTFLILLLGVVLALALAFGLGGRDRAAALIARWFPANGADRRP